MTKQEKIQYRKKIMENDFSKMNQMQQKAVFHVDGALLVLAGAGSGKTTVLVNRIANIIQYGNAYESEEFSENLTAEEEEELKACA